MRGYGEPIGFLSVQGNCDFGGSDVVDKGIQGGHGYPTNTTSKRAPLL